MCGEAGLPALSVYLAGSLLWSVAGGAEASSASHRRKPHKESKEVIGRGGGSTLFSCTYSSEGTASRISCTGPWISRRTSRRFWAFSKCIRKPKAWKNTQRNKNQAWQKTYAKIWLLLHSQLFFLLFVCEGEVKETQHSLAVSFHIGGRL